MRVALFVPCYMAALRPVDAQHAAIVLAALGDTVEVISGGCCGQPAFNSGYRREAKQVGRELLRAARHHECIVIPSGSCTSMVQHYLPGLFEGQRSEAARSIAGRVHEFAEYVAAHTSLGSLRLQLEGTVAYHDSCHERRELGLTGAVRSLLERIEGLELRSLAYEAECCGFGGAFSLKQREVSTAMMMGKLADVQESGVHVLVSTDLSCLAHLEAGARGSGLRLETWTVAELVSRALQ